MKRILSVFGTRPEAIKMAPLILAFNSCKEIHSEVCITSQHKEMLETVLINFNIKPDHDLKIIKPNQNLNDITSSVISGLSEIITRDKYDLIFVHGDTSSTLASALAAFQSRIPVAHVEAGLRTGNIFSPWPEEMNRVLTDNLSTLYFPPTEKASENLKREGKSLEKICVTGNTVIDALFHAQKILEENVQLKNKISDKFKFLEDSKKIILVTGHRRESFGKGFENICNALFEISRRKDVQIIYPVHLNPNVQEPVKRILSSVGNIKLLKPQEYFDFVFLMNKSYLIITDSGGIQEEAPSLGKPVLLLRDTTERPEAVKAGTVKMVGTNKKEIVRNTNLLLDDERHYAEMSNRSNPYGDGKASERIINFILSKYY